MSLTINPFAKASVAEASHLVRLMASEGLTTAELNELYDQIEATVPALVELRDAGFIDLNVRAIAEYGTLDGMLRLAEDHRLSDLARNRCMAMRDRMIVQGIRALLGHR